MGLGVLNVKGQQVPGTVAINEQENDKTHNPQLPLTSGAKNTGKRGWYTQTIEILHGQKYDTSGETAVLLVPQPSNDPMDPLNWPLWKRDLILLTLSSLAIIATTLSPILAADSLALTYYFRTTFTGVAELTGYHLLGVGVGGVLFVPSARIWGKRHAYLLGTIIVCFSSAWAGASNGHYNSMLAARFVQGIGLAPFEALLGASVGDLYCVHERGKRMALSTLAVFGSAFLTPVPVGIMADTIGWEWSFYLVAIFSGALLPICFFFCPETAFVRSEEFNNDMATNATNEKHAVNASTGSTGGYNNSNAATSIELESKTLDHSNASPSPSVDPELANHTHQTPISPRPSYWRSLALFNGRKSPENFFLLLLRPFPLFLQPGILWACLTQGALIGWTVFIGIVLAAILLGPPLYFSSPQVGYMYGSAFIGAIIGFALCGLLADSSTKLLTRWNRGVYEPEFRVLLVLPQFVLGGIGLYGFGITAGDTIRYGWIGPCIFFAFVTAGMVFGAVSSALYIVDAHRDIAVEAFTCLIIFKNVFAFALTLKGFDWLIQRGTRQIFIDVGSVQIGVCALSILMYVFGKWNRYLWSKYDILKMMRLR